ncbi:3'(2'),5'-bisphosphate nucleotidase CysQ [Siculibacillus lacustris]|uniref:3'(2'),5'-bisphosphate nucleotidase CysQ n=1 Tax=Siculibacillus lacustris TaxID=1549641 RepID=A0A4V2KSZ3_9HYPH|nr:3'(2'),5'-bisphosphate nucleotidase CysQ [Siculibacillus lacustris]TBW34984.1 3'(2'),5'-bisphosphate nucleotidase CysQ [Siculibacillus lacustris]
MPDADRGIADADTDADLALLAGAAREAGEIALGFFRRDPTVWTKSGGSPVSEADLAVDRHLVEVLRTARPDYGWLSEETADGPERLDRRRVFVVDPIDGTRAFLRGSDIWAVSIAVVEDGRPIVAMLHAPALGTTWAARIGRGAWCDGRRLAVIDRSELAGARVAGPRRYLDAPALIAAGFAAHDVVPSLAVRIARVADGALDVAYATRNAHDWDLAAADLLVQEAGGRFTVPSGEPLRYNRAVPHHPPLVAAVPGLHDAARILLARLEGMAA